MVYFPRYYQDLEQWLSPGRVLLIYGARRVGKTTLLNRFLQGSSYRYRLDSGDNIRVRNTLASSDFQHILDYVEGYDLIAIDEAQRIPDIGRGLKIIVDNAPNVRIIATGSSSFEMTQKVGEPLTGRKRTLVLPPLAQSELAESMNRHELRERLADYLVFGSYPEVLNASSKKERVEILRELADSYLLRDILAHENLRSSRTLYNLIKLLAFQMGSEVSLNELAGQVRLDVKTVDRYLDLLEKSFVIVRIGGYSRNLRKEVTSKAKYFFWDNGMRNAVIGQFNNFEDRADVGQLFESFLVTERLKKLGFEGYWGTTHFWRTYDRQEIDWIEDVDGSPGAYEFKWSPRKRVRPPLAWTRAYPGAAFNIVNSDNYLDFVL